MDQYLYDHYDPGVVNNLIKPWGIPNLFFKEDRASYVREAEKVGALKAGGGAVLKQIAPQIGGEAGVILVGAGIEQAALWGTGITIWASGVELVAWVNCER